MVGIECITSGQIITRNVILTETEELKSCYYGILYHLMKVGNLEKRKSVKEQLKLYRSLLVSDKRHVRKFVALPKKYVYFIIFDVMALINYDGRFLNKEGLLNISKELHALFGLRQNTVNKIFSIMNCDKKQACKIISGSDLGDAAEYASLAAMNIDFLNKKPVRILVTATMSAGKSTFINSLVGEEISMAQNMACTAKVHSIISKPFDDTLLGEYDSEVTVDADHKTLMDDNERNKKNELWASAFFKGGLAGERIIIKDSPGVNFSGNAEHAKITDKAITAHKFNIVICLLDYTQLHTNDMSEHIRFLSEHLGRKKIIFVLNKMDSASSRDNIQNDIDELKKTLISAGFKKPVICPVSASAGVMAKKTILERQMSDIEEWEFEAMLVKMKKMTLKSYYQSSFGFSDTGEPDRKGESLLYHSGIKYVEKIIKNYL